MPMPNQMQTQWANAKQAAMSQMQGDMGGQAQDPDMAAMEQLNSKMDVIIAMMQKMMGGYQNG